jgi:hypothetical protein
VKKILKNYVIKICTFLSRSLDFIKRRIIDPPEDSINWRPKYHHTWGMTETNYDFFVKEEIKSSYDHFKKYFHGAIFCLLSAETRSTVIKKSIEFSKVENEFFLEFGVFRGLSTNIFAKELIKEDKNIYAFDSFEGLLEDQVGHLGNYKGKFNRNKKIPHLEKNVTPVVGWIQDTLPDFINKNLNDDSKIRFIHIDVDTYETTKFILENLKKYLTCDSIILFDELYNMPGWTVGEYKALQECFKEEEYSFICFTAYGEQAAIKIKK